MPRLAFDVGLDLNNRVKGGEKLPITVDATLPQDTEGEVKQVKTWAFCDDGATWNPVGLTPGNAPGAYTGTLHLPRTSSTSGYVTLRTHATDVSGNSIDQTVKRAFGLD